MLAILLESTETRSILSWMRMNLRSIRCGSLCFKFPKASVRRIRCGERAAVSFMPGGGLRLIRIDGSSDPERKTEMVSGIGSCLSLSINT